MDGAREVLRGIVDDCRRDGEHWPAATPAREPSSKPIVVETQNKGHVLVTTCELAPGDVCLVDEPLIEYPNVTGRGDLDWLSDQMGLDDDDAALLGYACMQYAPDEINALVAGLHFSRQPAEVQRQVLSIFCPPIDDPSVKETVELATLFHERFDESLNIPLHDYIRALLIKKVNGFEHKERRSVILYGTGCRLSHSCKPNCFRTVLPDGRLLVRAVAPTAAGDELAISYLRPEKMFSSAKERLQYLSEGYLFHCDCPRCVAPHDDTRGAECLECRRGSVQLPVNPELPSTPCTNCGVAMPPGQVRRLGDAEQALHTEALRLEKGSSFLPGIGPILKLVGDCRKEGLGQHHTPYAACDLLYFCALSLGDYPLAAEAAAVQIDYLRHVYDAYPLPVAWKYEALADALAGMVKQATSEPGGSQPDARGQGQGEDAGCAVAVNANDVVAVYARAYHIMLGCYGPQHRFSREIEDKSKQIAVC